MEQRDVGHNDQHPPIKKHPVARPPMKMKTAEWLMIILTGIIALLTAGNILVYALLTKATIVQGQDALNASIVASHLDQRAWVGLSGSTTIGGAETENRKGFSYKTVQITIRNSGKTPAINLSAITLETTRNWNDEIGDYDAVTAEEKQKREELEAKHSEELIRRNPQSADRIRAWNNYTSGLESTEEKALFPAGQVIAPESELVQGVVGVSYENLQQDMMSQVIYILGKITYNDIFDGTPLHTTKFCLERIGGTEFVPCSTGNHMD